MMESREKLIIMWAWMFVSAPFCHAEVPETFSVLVPDGPVSAKLGSSVVLPCSLSPSFSAVELEVRWYRPNQFTTPVLLYKNQKIQESPVDPQYRDRVSLIGSLEEGNVSLKLENITLSDRREYECHVISATWYDKDTASLTVNVLGSVPVLSFTETGRGTLNVTCVSDGWSPQPTVTWRDREGREINKNSNVMYSKDAEDLVRVSSWLLFSPSESEWISCSVSLSDQEKREGRVMPLRSEISDSATSTASNPPWRAFIVMLVISLLSFSVLFILFFILYKKRDPQKPVDTAPAGHHNTQSGDTVLFSVETQPLKQETRNEETRSQEGKYERCEKRPKTADKETNTDPGWNIVRFCKEDLTMDASTCHKPLAVKNRGKEVSFVKAGRWSFFQSHNPTDLMVDVLCKEKFKSGWHYWEVIVLDLEKAAPPALSWYVGVTSHEEKERKKEPLTPENGYWVLQYERGKLFCENTSRQNTVLERDLFSTLGVYLDMTKNTLSFHDVDSESHLYTFTDVRSENVLIPLFSPGDRCEHSLMLK